MDILNESSLQSLLLACYNNAGYHGAIVFDSIDRLNEFLRNIVDANGKFIQGIKKVETLNNPITCHIVYVNGSQISIALCNTVINNNMFFHTVLLDDSVIEPTTIIALQHRVHKYSARTALYKEVADDAISGISESFRDTNELDEFLNSFRIIE